MQTFSERALVWGSLLPTTPLRQVCTSARVPATRSLIGAMPKWPRRPYIIGVSPAQDGTNITPITSFTMRATDDYATLYRQSFSVQTYGLYHLVLNKRLTRVISRPATASPM
jgi:hypothetical protein